jgi:hypothetical protein
MRENPRLQMDERDLRIAEGIRRLPDLEPPPNLLGSVMRSIQPKRLSRWRRISLWARSPKTITWIPFRVIPAAIVVLIVLISAVLLLNSGKKDQPPLFVQANGTTTFPVSFTLDLPGTHSVSVMGTFNQWRSQGFEMQWDKEREVWSLTLRLPEGRHEYAFLIDGQRVISDPGAHFYQADGFGNQNSVLILRGRNGESI